MPTRLLLVPAILLALTGCATQSISTSQTAGETSTSSGARFTGQLRGGQQPVIGATVQLYAVNIVSNGGISTPLLTPAVMTDGNGSFTLTGLYTCPSPSALVYIVGTGGSPGASVTNPQIALMTALGQCGSLTDSTTIQVDERTTVAAVTALAPFMTSYSAIGSSPVDAAGLSAAFTLADSFVNSSNGQPGGASLPANATVPANEINTLGNVLAACINSPGGAAGDTSACGQFFTAAKPSGGNAPTDTIGATLNLARDPMRNVASYYDLAGPTAPFQPELSSAPTDWTVDLTGSGAPPVLPLSCTQALSGTAAFTDYTKQVDGICRLIRNTDLPAPYATSDVNNNPQIVARSTQMPVVPPGFKVTLYSSLSSGPRYLLAAANGDIFVAEQSSGKIVVLRGVDANGSAVSQSTYATGLNQPYGMAFYPATGTPQYLYVGEENALGRFPYSVNDTVASGSFATLATDIPNGGNHITRSIVFTNEPTPRLLVGVGSANNVIDTDTTTAENHRANVLAYSVDGAFQSIYASGTRNPVGLALSPSGQVWIGVNERDDLGDNLPADYVTHISEGGFYGWPWYFNGPNADPRLPNSHPELASQSIVGDVLLQPHFAPLQIAFYTGTQFPTPYQGDIFVTSHGSWNKNTRGGYEILRLHLVNGAATGAFEDFMTGFVNSNGTVWGRPAAVAVGADGALYVGDDAGATIWRVTYTGS